jgi:uncharacterized membrane-anchored protein YitT (DUF2179 family)
MPNLQAFFSRTFRPFFLATGAGTALVGIFAVLPSWAMPNILKLPHLVEYTIIIQHWGIMVGLMGLFMMGAALVPRWHVPIALYSLVEKAFMVWLVLVNVNQPFVAGFWIPFALDLTVVAYTIGYFYFCGFNHSLGEQPAQSR